ncbi:DUF5667 domain-containing protein [Pseudonocardia hispaniensis]|uniref:DUF5667 domain-containing protein n=1 Tax=Pseudonocardia hispaniensis TaxID=904933 RepID=A0ABW1IZS0_9PSEU
MPAGQGEDEQRFAGQEPGRPPGDSAMDELAHEVALAAALDRGRPSLSPDPDATARMRARLFAALAEQAADQPPGPPAPAASRGDAAAPARPLGAAAPADGDETAAEQTTQLAPLRAVDRPEEEPGPATTSLGHGIARRRRGRHTMPRRADERTRPAVRGPRRRVGVLSAAALLVMVAMAGSGVFASRDALPGDALYGIKRITESTSLALTWDDEAKARRHLDLAATRLGEIEQLVARQRAAAPDPALLESTISEFEAAASEGSRMLLTAPQATGAWLVDLRTWAATQAARLTALRTVLPAPAVAEADHSLVLLERMLNRADALRTRLSCSDVISGAVDDLGPLPAEGACVPRSEGADSAGLGGTVHSSASSSATTPSSDGAATPSPGPTERDPEGGLLSGLTPDQNPLGTAPGIASSTVNSTTGVPTTGPASSGPLLPPIKLPPLLPGMPGITIG